MNISNGFRKNRLMNWQAISPQNPHLLLVGRLVPWMQLTKLPLCLLVAFSSLFGSALAAPVQIPQIALTTTGMLLLACGCAVLNSLQEIHLDASMGRTQERPLPQGSILGKQAAILALLLFVFGILALYLGSSLLRTLCLSLGAVALYNVFYTPLKKRTIAAIIPGAISGALPPYIGWTSAGGDPFSSTAFLLIVLFIFWQVPHSLFILLHHKDDYLHNSLPSLVKILPESSLKRICSVWIGAFTTGVLFLCVVPLGLTNAVKVLLLISVWVLFVTSWIQLNRVRKPDYPFLSIQLNAYLLFTMAILAGDRLFF
jgi:protoheme IX farnesyltransferase